MFAFGKEGLGNNAKHLIPTVEAFGGFLIAQVNKGDSYSFLARKGEYEVSLTVSVTFPDLLRQTFVAPSEYSFIMPSKHAINKLLLSKQFDFRRAKSFVTETTLSRQR